MRNALAFLVLLIAAPVSAGDMPELFIAKCRIEDGLRQYSGSCPCPWREQTDAAECKQKSAWNQSLGLKPYCYVDEFSDDMAREYQRNPTPSVVAPRLQLFGEASTPERDKCPTSG
jgi:hypothetical protein